MKTFHWRFFREALQVQGQRLQGDKDNFVSCLFAVVDARTNTRVIRDTTKRLEDRLIRKRCSVPGDD
jgi:hypothetical protein